MKSNKKPTLKDIAHIAKISVNSVSRALRNDKNISLKTRQRVMNIANKIGYIPDISAKTLRRGTMDVIAVVYDNLTNPYYSMMLSKINLELFKLNYEAMIFVDHHSIGYLSKEISLKVISYKVAAIITFIEPTIEAKRILDDSKIPLVLIGRNGIGTSTNSVYSNDEKGGGLAAKVLINKGCDDFIYYTLHSTLDIDKSRLKGFNNELLNHNIQLKNENIIQGNLVNSPNNLLINLLTNNSKNIGIFCFSDLIAFEVLQIIKENNLNINNNIKVIGYDNLQSSFPYPIRVSSIAPDTSIAIDEALNIVFSQIKNGYSSELKLVETDVNYFEGTTT